MLQIFVENGSREKRAIVYNMSIDTTEYENETHGFGDADELTISVLIMCSLESNKSTLS